MSRDPWWQKYVPGYARSPFKLALRLLADGNPAARSAMYMAALGIATAPLDLMLFRKEARIYRAAPDPRRPIILVCGAPRSGTTLVAQYLINNLNVGYLNNLTSLFPRSPIYANQIFGRYIKRSSGSYNAFYGKSRGLAGANDALYIWDRWLGSDRDAIPALLTNNDDTQMIKFFGALEKFYDRPIVNKVNRLNTCAALVAAELPTARFICVVRDPLNLAQSLYVARQKIMGDSNTPYGVRHHPSSTDPILDVCLQVVFHEKKIRQQHAALGDDRFLVLSYEQFCAKPTEFLAYYIDRNSGLERSRGTRGTRESFSVSNKHRLPKDTLDRMRNRLIDLGAYDINFPVLF